MKSTNKNQQKAAGYQLASANARVKAATFELNAAKCDRKAAGYLLAASTKKK